MADANDLLCAYADTKDEAFWSVPLEGLSAKDQIFRAVWQCEAEINNGGFDQYFINSAGDDAPSARRALLEIGAHEMSKILSAAIAIVADVSSWPSFEARRRILGALDQQALDQFEALDQAFYAYPDDLSGLLCSYVLGADGTAPGART